MGLKYMVGVLIERYICIRVYFFFCYYMLFFRLFPVIGSGDLYFSCYLFLFLLPCFLVVWCFLFEFMFFIVLKSTHIHGHLTFTQTQTHRDVGFDNCFGVLMFFFFYFEQKYIFQFQSVDIAQFFFNLH